MLLTQMILKVLMDRCVTFADRVSNKYGKPGEQRKDGASNPEFPHRLNG